MRTVRTVAELREQLAAGRRRGASIGLVPTMGAFHEGHRALMRAARAECDVVVVSLFVNPTQFDDAGDLAAYPRTEQDDAAEARNLGVDVLFAPRPDAVYPPGFTTIVTASGISDRLEGASRPGHFAGVATVVTKLLNMVGPDVAYFGQKDAQQTALVRRVVRDLDIPVAIRVLPTVREPDGLAMSSRNGRLGPADRERATALFRGLSAAREAVAVGERDAARVRASAEEAMRRLGVEPEYVALVDPDDFSPVRAVNGRVLVAVAARVGGVRLIDNILLTTEAGAAP